MSIFPLPKKGTSNRLTPDRLKAIVIDIYAGLGATAICKKHKLSPPTLSNIRNGKIKADEVIQIVQELGLEKE